METIRVCNKCNTPKAESEFYFSNGRYYSFCKQCKRITNSAWHSANSERHHAMNKAWAKRNKDKTAAYYKKYVQANRVALAAKQKAYVEKNKARIYAVGKIYREKNSLRIAANVKAWHDANPNKRAANRAKRRAAESMALPKWYGEFDKFVFEEAKLLSKEREIMTGITYHVDHIVPINSKIVSGFHCASNFRVIPASENISKGNRRDPSWEC